MNSEQMIEEFERNAKAQLEELKATSQSRVQKFVDRGMAKLQTRIEADKR